MTTYAIDSEELDRIITRLTNNLTVIATTISETADATEEALAALGNCLVIDNGTRSFVLTQAQRLNQSAADARSVLVHLA